MEVKIDDYGLMKFSEKEIAGFVKVELPLTHNDIETIMVTAIEGGIGYWACLINEGKEWDRKPKGVPSSQWATQLLLEGKEVVFEDEEDGKTLKLTLQKLIKGFGLNYKNRPHDNDLENGDSNTSDAIIQYALFGDVIYG